MPLICIVIPLYNGEAWIGGTLDAVLAQTRPPDRVVVVDDGSTDDGPDIVRGYDSVELLQNPGKGANPARAWGLDQTQSDYVALLDQDDRWAPQHLERLTTILDDHPDCPAAIGNNTIYHLGSEPVFAAWPDTVEQFDQWEHFPFLTIASPSGALFRRSLLEASGGWPTHIEGVADMLTFFRVSVQAPIWRTTACTWARGEHDSSYSAKLRGPGHSLRYMDKISQAAREAMAARIKHHPDQEEHLTNRLSYLLLIREILAALDTPNPKALRDAAVRFESAYAPSSDRDRWLACSGLAWMASLAGRGSSGGRLVSSELLRNWPGSARVTGQTLVDRIGEMVGRSMAWDYFCGAPLDPRRGWRLVATSSRQFRNLMKRLLRRTSTS